ncbi:MAG: aminomethyl-transferring glycine dehydrogenase subunit GcvPA [Muribaculum sp.]|nr:aminomethyl-transferring glycine dehydrogenase subunit GcvPA [Muribaculaceae bacterium]MCM1080873.1 aminomethyl-transferring glycine dehydrogenase subunit GcvPA [Muribaculum sp.]
MNHPYFPHTQEDLQYMLSKCKVGKLDDLYADVPEQLLLKRDYNLPSEKSEVEIRAFFDKMFDNNKNLTCFAGGGYYNHYTPAVIPYITSRSEFLTAYTPYQPEISQGTLQYIFEYQTMMCRLTGLDVSNASMYDGATATAEAMMMTVAAARKRNRVLVSSTVLPQVLAVMHTYAHYHGIQIEEIPATAAGVTSIDDLKRMLQEYGDVAGVVLPQPNRYGIVENFEGVAEAVHKAKATLAMTCVASTLAVLKTPAEWGADIAAGDGQSLGIPLNYGGPYIGFLCCTQALVRKLPGRIVGATTDTNGKRVFVLTLQAREQHIRREKATSNICSNQGLMSLFVTVYMSLMGPQGMAEVNNKSAVNARYIAQKVVASGKAKLKYPDSPYLNEFVLGTDKPVDKILAEGIEAGVLCGIKLAENELMVAATEVLSVADMDKLVKLIVS